ncbi:olfactory receptor 7A17-like [Rhinolophus sinicus]|uniref:olfactory receptor 7A17-like n=1 Tax=Rhinolophus sinicus TaxID=89399 RepID=UPI003D7C1130
MNLPGSNSGFYTESSLSETPSSHVFLMEPENLTRVSEFVLLGLSEEPDLQPLLFGLFLSMYLITVLGNLLIVLAICHPLHYTVIMHPRLCGQFVLLSWIMSVLISLLNNLMVLRLSFCADLQIPHFFCELIQMIQLACSDNFVNNLVIYFVAVLLSGGPVAGILYSYSKIISSVRAMSSAQGKYKAFSTCASHLSVVSLFYLTGLGVYLSFPAAHNAHSSATASVLYTVVTPMLNPFIYSLRNNDIKGALKRSFGMKCKRDNCPET